MLQYSITKLQNLGNELSPQKIVHQSHEKYSNLSWGLHKNKVIPQEQTS